VDAAGTPSAHGRQAKENCSMIQQIARLAGNVDLAICVQAVEVIVAYYRPGNYTATQTIELLACYLIAGEEDRAIVYQFREEVARLQVLTALEKREI
jgi:hypothetical protein